MIVEAAVRELAARYGGRAREQAFLELAQEHLLHWMAAEGLFNGGVAFKGGTAIRTFMLGLQGRFSTDLDFSCQDGVTGAYVQIMLAEGFDHEGVHFKGSAIEEDDDGRHIRWTARTAEFGESLPARLDFTTYGLLLPTARYERQELPGVDERLGFDLVTPPIVDVRENVSEKLARYRRTIVARDVYDLAMLAATVREDLGLIRQLLCFKVYGDVVLQARGGGKFRGGEEFRERAMRQVPDGDDLGQLTNTRVDVAAMQRKIADIYGAMGVPTSPSEKRLAACVPSDADRYWAVQEAARFRAEHEQRV